jgi:16S rRNA (uracil1498-N3)-methyltransferase
VVERARHASVGTFYAPGDWRSGERVELDAAAVHHATVKRIAAGDGVRLTDGAGRRAAGVVESVSKRSCVILLAAKGIEVVDRPMPVELWAPVGDRERMLMLAEKAVELGVSSWRPIVYARSRSVSPRGEGEAFREKVRLRQISALEQSGGAWLPDVHAEASLDAALEACGPESSALRVLLDVDGESIASMGPAIRGSVVVALGPEGGLEEHERDMLITHGWRPVSLGANVLRFETAGIAALAVLRALSPADQ